MNGPTRHLPPRTAARIREVHNSDPDGFSIALVIEAICSEQFASSIRRSIDVNRSIDASLAREIDRIVLGADRRALEILLIALSAVGLVQSARLSAANRGAHRDRPHARVRRSFDSSRHRANFLGVFAAEISNIDISKRLHRDAPLNCGRFFDNLADHFALSAARRCAQRGGPQDALGITADSAFHSGDFLAMSLGQIP